MTILAMSNASHNRNHGIREELVHRSFDRTFARLYVQMCQKQQALRLRPVARQYMPRMDLFDDESQPNISAMLELPGVAREHISVLVRDGKLVVHGERGSPLSSRLQTGSASSSRDAGPPSRDNHMAVSAPPNPTNYRVRELKFGSFHREIELPAGTQTVHISAEMSDGMLFLSWPRNPTLETSTTTTSISAP